MIFKPRKLIKKAQDIISDLTPSPTSVMDIQTNILEPQTPVADSYRAIIHNTTLPSPRSGSSPKAVNVPVDLGAQSFQFYQFIDESNGDRQSYACAANSNRRVMSINNSSAGGSISNQVDNGRTVQSGDTGNNKDVNQHEQREVNDVEIDTNEQSLVRDGFRLVDIQDMFVNKYRCTNKV